MYYIFSTDTRPNSREEGALQRLFPGELERSADMTPESEPKGPAGLGEAVGLLIVHVG
jgi:hypothetical protein